MEKKDLKKLSRAQLLELLIALAKENKTLKEQLANAELKLLDKEIATKEAGSIAQASLQLNNVFEAAQSAADQYIENLRRMENEQAEICKRMKATEMELQAELARQAEVTAAKLAAEKEIPEAEPVKKKRGLFGIFKKQKGGDGNE